MTRRKPSPIRSLTDPRGIVTVMTGVAGLTIILGFAKANTEVGWTLLFIALGIQTVPNEKRKT